MAATGTRAPFHEQDLRDAAARGVITHEQAEAVLAIARAGRVARLAPLFDLPWLRLALALGAAAAACAPSLALWAGEALAPDELARRAAACVVACALAACVASRRAALATAASIFAAASAAYAGLVAGCVAELAQALLDRNGATLARPEAWGLSSFAFVNRSLQIDLAVGHATTAFAALALTRASPSRPAALLAGANAVFAAWSVVDYAFTERGIAWVGALPAGVPTASAAALVAAVSWGARSPEARARAEWVAAGALVALGELAVQTVGTAPPDDRLTQRVAWTLVAACVTGFGVARGRDGWTWAGVAGLVLPSAVALARGGSGLRGLALSAWVFAAALLVALHALRLRRERSLAAEGRR